MGDLMDLNLYHMVGTSNSINEAWENWSSSVTGIINKHAPARTYRVKNRSNPWITHDIIMLMYERDAAHKQASKSQCPRLYRNYKCLRNQVVRRIRSAKKQYYTNEVNHSKSTKNTWRVLRQLIGSKKASSQASQSPSADVFNNYFSQVGPKLNSKFSAEAELFWTQPPCIYKFEFSEICEDAVFKELGSLSTSSNIDVLGFDSKLLYEGADILASSLTMLFNLSTQCHELPADWKRARVTPVYKGKGSADDPGNYRPISVVAHIAKIFEKSINQQLISYLTEHDLLTHSQSAFRRGHSTSTAAHRLIDDLLVDSNEGLLTAACMFDLSKCFDTIDHKLLLEKMSKYGFIDETRLWFENYLYGRTQAVASDGAMSQFCTISSGVPQGSVLGPTLFLLFVNDLPSCLLNSFNNIYADDTEIHVSGTTVEEVCMVLQPEIDRIVHWFHCNKLTVNITKTCCILFTTNRNVLSTKLNLTVDGNPIEQVTSLKYLGLHPDSSFTWTEHISQLCNKISPKIGLLRKLKHLLPVQCVDNVYRTTVQPHIDYCLPVWGFTSGINLQRVQRLQNRAARIITGNFDFFIRGIDLVKQLGWQTVSQRRDYFTCLTVFKSLRGLAPHYMQDLFTYRNDIVDPDVVTRSSSRDDLFVPLVTKQVYAQSLQFTGAQLWNSLPVSIRQIQSLDTFKAHLKKHLSNV
jgi:hypothetical protein